MNKRTTFSIKDRKEDLNIQRYKCYYMIRNNIAKDLFLVELWAPLEIILDILTNESKFHMEKVTTAR